MTISTLAQLCARIERTAVSSPRSGRYAVTTTETRCAASTRSAAGAASRSNGTPSPSPTTGPGAGSRTGRPQPRLGRPVRHERVEQVGAQAAERRILDRPVPPEQPSGSLRPLMGERELGVQGLVGRGQRARTERPPNQVVERQRVLGVGGQLVLQRDGLRHRRDQAGRDPAADPAQPAAVAGPGRGEQLVERAGVAERGPAEQRAGVQRAVAGRGGGQRQPEVGADRPNVIIQKAGQMGWTGVPHAPTNGLARPR